MDSDHIDSCVQNKEVCNPLQEFKIDEKLVLDLRVRDMELDEINAVVLECEQLDNGLYCTRVKFCFLEKHMRNPRIMHALLQIEDRLRIEREYPN